MRLEDLMMREYQVTNYKLLLKALFIFYPEKEFNRNYSVMKCLNDCILYMILFSELVYKEIR